MHPLLSPLPGSITAPPPAQTSNFPGRCPRKAARPGPPSSCCLQNSPPLLSLLDHLGWMRVGAKEKAWMSQTHHDTPSPYCPHGRSCSQPHLGFHQIPHCSQNYQILTVWGPTASQLGPPGNSSGQPGIFRTWIRTCQGVPGPDHVSPRESVSFRRRSLNPGMWGGAFSGRITGLQPEG